MSAHIDIPEEPPDRSSDSSWRDRWHERLRKVEGPGAGDAAAPGGDAEREHDGERAGDAAAPGGDAEREAGADREGGTEWEGDAKREGGAESGTAG